jgi:dihydroorotase
MSRVFVRNGHVVDPSQQLDRPCDLLIENGKIAAIDAPFHDGYYTDGTVVVDATNRIVTPGLIDMHAELREPGHEEDETIRTGTAAAIAGGFATVACIPSTDPPIDSQASVEFVLHQARRAANCNVVVLACVSKNREGEQLAEMGSLTEAGAVGFTDAGRPVRSAELMRRALQYCLMLHRPILNHPESPELSAGGIMHEGFVSTVLGLAGMPVEAEDLMTNRDVRLAEATGGQLHLMNLSSAGSVELVRRAKHRQVNVTAAVCPHHLVLTDESLRSFHPNFKVNPPLRSQEHVDGLLEGLKDGTLDVIASGHSPRAEEKKMQDLKSAPFGISAIETALALAITSLIRPGHLSWTQLVEKMSCNPARILALTGKGSLRAGSDADITIIDPEEHWFVDSQTFCSRGRNTPFEGRSVYGRATQVIVQGQLVAQPLGV